MPARRERTSDAGRASRAVRGRRRQVLLSTADGRTVLAPADQPQVHPAIYELAPEAAGIDHAEFFAWSAAPRRTRRRR